MRIAVIGFGNAGSKIADRILEYEHDTGRSLCRSVLAINSARTDLAKLDYIPGDKQVLIGQTDEQVKGHGVGGDPDLGAKITREDGHELNRALDDVPIYDIDAFLVIAGLGGGTGSGGAPELSSTLNEMYEEPVYGLAILPSTNEGGRASLNAGRTLPSFTEATDNLLVFDNETWQHSDDSIEGGYEKTNGEIATRIVTLLAAGELDGTEVSENAMDASDIRRTLSTGGVSTIAYAETELSRTTERQRGLLGRLRNDRPDATRNGADPATKVKGLVRQAVRSRLTCPAAVESAERSLIVLSGPPSEFSRKGLETARQWVEQETESAEVLAGDDPRSAAGTLSAVVLLSNVTDVSRIDRLQKQAVAAQNSIEEQASSRDAEIEELITDEEDRLDPI